MAYASISYKFPRVLYALSLKYKEYYIKLITQNSYGKYSYRFVRA